MPSRNQAKIRRDIGRLKDTIDRGEADNLALAVLKPVVDSAAHSVKQAWQAYQQAAVEASRERDERKDAVQTLATWVQTWRPVVLLTVPGASSNVSTLPRGGATPDDVIRAADDLRDFVASNPGAASFRDKALKALGDGIAIARKEASEAQAARPMEAAAREALTEASIAANGVLVRGTEVIRAIFGPTSPQYKQFIGRMSKAEDDAEATDSEAGET